jgi:O-antigen ligase
MLYLLAIFAIYLPFQLATNAAPGTDLASIRILAILIFLIWIFKSLAQRKLFVPNKIQTLLILSFLFINSLSLFFAGNLDWGTRKLFFLFSFFPLYFVFANVFKNKNNSRKIITALVFGAGLISLVGIFQFLLQFIIGLDPALILWSKVVAPFLGADFSQAVLTNPSWLVAISGHTLFRAIAFFPDPHMFSFYLNIILPFSIALFLSYFSKNSKQQIIHLSPAGDKCIIIENKKSLTFKKYIFLSASILIMIADLLTFSRGGYAGLFAGFVVAVILLRSKVRSKVSNRQKLILIIAFILIVTAIIFSPIKNRFISSFNFSEGSNQGRIETWKQSLGLIIDNPLIGTGVGNYSLAIKPSADYREPIYSHNLYFDIAAETGIINALVFIFLIIFSLRAFYKNRNNNPFAYAGIISLVAFSIHSLFETPLYSVQILPLLILIFALNAVTYESENA